MMTVTNLRRRTSGHQARSSGYRQRTSILSMLMLWLLRSNIFHIIFASYFREIYGRRDGLAVNGSRKNSHGSSSSSFTSEHPPYWPKYSGSARRVQLLDGIWNTSRINPQQRQHANSFDSMDPYLDVSTITTPNLTTIPSTVDNAPPGYLGVRGVHFYRTFIQRRPKYRQIMSTSNSTTIRYTTGAVRIQFQACSFYCRVWINGHDIGDHRAGGYVAWYIDVPLHILNDNKKLLDEDFDAVDELVVLVDNRWNETTAPMHTGGDFWHYGGILRSVEWHVFYNVGKDPDSSTRINNDDYNDDSPETLQSKEKSTNVKLWPWRLYVFPQSDLRSVQLKLQLVQTEYVGPVDNVIISFDDDLSDVESGSAEILANGILVGGYVSSNEHGLVDLGTVSVPSRRLWSTHNPQLHTITIHLNDATVTERFGMRYFDTTNVASDRNDGNSHTRIRLNGHVLKLVGWNHHTQWPYTAASPTDKQLDDDLRLLKEQGHVNFVRGAHYPQDPRWLDRLDEAGIVMWCETLGPATTVENMQDDYFLRYQRQQINEMLDHAMNHPSIAFWAFFNEGPSHKKEACLGYQVSADAISTRDSTRFITYASNRDPQSDKCVHVATVLSHNGYPGWYQTKTPVQFWNDVATAVARTNKPLVISETGAGGIYEWTHNNTVTKWTLQYQTDIIVQDVVNAIDNPDISGISLWHFFDFKVADQWENNTYCEYAPNVEPPTCQYINVNTSESFGRPGGLNHKGVLDFYRRPKPSFSIIAAHFANVTQFDTRIVNFRDDPNIRTPGSGTGHVYTDLYR